VTSESLPYRDFYYPLNVFMHLLSLEEGEVRYLHYGLFDGSDATLIGAQERSTALLLERLPKPPARLLDVGSGIGTTLDRLTRLGYDVTGITPDTQQLQYIHARYGDALHLLLERFETLRDVTPFDVIVFQESSQYIDSEALFAQAARLTRRVLVLDEFATLPAGHLHQWMPFIEASARHGFSIAEQLELSEQAAPTIDYFNERYPRYRDRLIADLGLSPETIDALIQGGLEYRAAYTRGDYVYRLVDFRRHEQLP
jgi:SAM-dependent methyltransferase